MVHGVRSYLVGSVLLGVLGLLGACSGGWWFAQREPWRAEAEARCIGSGAVKEGAGIARVNAIRGPGVCGADLPLRVSAFGDGIPMAYAGELRPPGSIPTVPARASPRWPSNAPNAAPPPRYEVERSPVSLDPPGSIAPPGAVGEPYDFRRPYGTGASPVTRMPADRNSPAHDLSPEPYERRRAIEEAYPPPRYHPPPARVSPRPVPLGPSRGVPVTGAVGAVSVSPAATLACPIVSALDQWIAGSVQPAAMRWFGQPVIEIRQISAYSCRGMNGNPNARISEHAFGNALDISAFTLANGRKITVKNGWRGRPEEQGFLRDIQAAACDQFTTVLAPGSNVYHYDHIHVDLMRRSGGRRACNPSAVSGEEIAARAAARYAGRDASVTGSVGDRRSARTRPNAYAEERPGRALPIAVPGEDGLVD